MRDDEYIISLCDELLGAIAKRQRTFAFVHGEGYCARAEAHYRDLELVIEYQEQRYSEPAMPRRGPVVVLTYADFEHTADRRLRRNPSVDRAVLFEKLHEFIPALADATAH